MKLVERLHNGYAYYGPYADAVEADEIERLQEELANAQKQIKMLRDAISWCRKVTVDLDIHDALDHALAAKDALLNTARELISRYRFEIPPGRQPHMICLEAEDCIAAIDKEIGE